MPKKHTCKGLFYRDSKLSQRMSKNEIKENIICVPNKAGTEQYYKLDYETKTKFNFVGKKTLIEGCFKQLKDSTLPVCKHTSAYSVNPDFHLIKIYLASLENEDYASERIRESILMELEELKESNPDSDIWDDKSFIEEFEKKFNENRQKIQIAPHIYEFFLTLAEYTDITLDKLDEIFRGGHTIIRGDKGLTYQKILQKSENQIKEAEQKGVTHSKLKDPLVYSYAEFFQEDDPSKISTKISHRSYTGSTHPSYDYTQLRMGAGSIWNCNEKSSRCINTNFDLLIGTSVQKETLGDTWFQLEGSRMGSNTGSKLDKLLDKNFLSHSFDAGLYLFTKYGSQLHIPLVKKLNIGPFGTSYYHDTNPQYLFVCENITDRETQELAHCIHKTNKSGRKLKVQNK